MCFCKNREKFCAICGEYTTKKEKRTITSQIKENYELYFGFALVENSWSPSQVCNSCACSLRNWRNNKGYGMRFGVPMIWRQPKEHEGDCYFCAAPDLTGKKKNEKGMVAYPHNTSAERPVPHSIELPVPKAPSSGKVEEDNAYVDNEAKDPDYEDQEENNTHKPSQGEVDDFVRDLQMAKEKSEVCVARLRQWGLVQNGVKSSHYRTRDLPFSQFFSKNEKMVFCHDIDGLMRQMNLTHDPSEWRLFLDSSMKSFKVVLLHNGNLKPTVPVAYSTTMKEDYDNVKLILKSINYKKYQWKIVCDLKMVQILLGMQAGFTRHCCFLCLFNSRARQHHYHLKKWPKRNKFKPGKENIKKKPLVSPDVILIPPLHVKLGVFKNWVKALDKSGPGFVYLRSKFPSVSDAKSKEGVYVGPHIRALLKDEKFTVALKGLEKKSWLSFKAVALNFFGNKRAPNYAQLIEHMLADFKKLGVLMSPKIHLLHSHLDRFPLNCGAYSDEMGERFHQDLAPFEKRFQGRVIIRMLGDYCWNQTRASLDVVYKRQTRKRPHE